MGSYEDTQEALRGLDKVDEDRLRDDIEKGIVLLDESTAMINDYLARLKANPTNHKRQMYVINGGKR